MALVWTTRGLNKALSTALLPDKIRLCTAATAPTKTGTKNITDLTEIANGNGYSTTTGIAVSCTSAEDDGNSRSTVTIPDSTTTASGGTIANIRYAVVCDSADDVWAYDDIGATSVADGIELRLQNGRLDLTT